MGGKTTNFNWDYGVQAQTPWWDEWATIFQGIDTELYGIKHGTTVLDDIKTKSPWVDVRAYGANTTPGTTDMAATFNLAGATGYPVFVPTNEIYRIDSDITVKGMYGLAGKLPTIKLYNGASIIIDGGYANLYTPFSYLDIQPQDNNTIAVDIKRQMVYSRGIRIYGDNTKTGCTGLFFNVDAASQVFHDFDDFQILDVHKPIHVYDTGTGYFNANKIGSLHCHIYGGILESVPAITLELNTANEVAANYFGSYITNCRNVVDFKKSFTGNTFDVHLDNTTYLEKLAIENAGNKFLLIIEIDSWIDPLGVQTTNYGADNIYSIKGQMNHVYSFSSGSQYLGRQDGLVLANATSGDLNVYLPDSVAAAGKGKVIRTKKTDSSAHTVTIHPDGADTIDGAATIVLSLQYESITLMGGGGNWHIVSYFDGSI